MDEDIYSLDELIKRLEDIREGKDPGLNFPKAFLTLAKEIQKITVYEKSKTEPKYIAKRTLKG